MATPTLRSDLAGMPPRFIWRVVAALLPLLTGVLGLVNGTSDWHHATTMSQQIAGAGVILYGPLGVLTAVALLGGLRWWRPALIAWAVIISVVGGFSPVAWGDAPPVYGILAGFSSALICAGVLWAATMAFPASAPGPTP